MNNTEQLENCVENALREIKLDHLIILNKIKAAWNEVVGVPIAKKTHPYKIENKHLLIACNDSVYAHQVLINHQRNIIDYIRVVAGRDMIKQIRFVLYDVEAAKQLDSADESILDISDQRAISPEEESTIETTAALIEDKKTKNRFKRWYFDRLTKHDDDL